MGNRNSGFNQESTDEISSEKALYQGQENNHSQWEGKEGLSKWKIWFRDKRCLRIIAELTWIRVAARNRENRKLQEIHGPNGNKNINVS